MTLRISLVNYENFMKNKADSFGLFKRKIPFLKKQFYSFPFAQVSKNENDGSFTSHETDDIIFLNCALCARLSIKI